MQLLSADARVFLKNFAPENMNKPPAKVAHNQPPFFFSVLPICPKPAQISFSVPCFPAGRLYNDFNGSTAQ